jgi:L-methionine (R)-S-oxide reductase
LAEETLVADRAGELRMTAEDKSERYALIAGQLRAALGGERDLTAAMATVVCLLHNAFPYYFWTGFYRRVGPERLLIGPYQGTMGCLEIAFGRGVCGTAALRRETVIVDDVHAFPGHITCDAAAVSEIVVPVLDADGELIGVFDVDSTLPAAFDETDARALEKILALLSGREPLPVVWRPGPGA